MSWEHLHDIIRLVHGADLADAQAMRRALQDEGINCMVLGDHLGVAVGGMSGGRAEVWVETCDWVRADAILRGSRQSSSGAARGGPDLGFTMTPRVE